MLLVLIHPKAVSSNIWVKYFPGAAKSVLQGIFSGNISLQNFTRAILYFLKICCSRNISSPNISWAADFWPTKIWGWGEHSKGCLGWCPARGGIESQLPKEWWSQQEARHTRATHDVRYLSLLSYPVALSVVVLDVTPTELQRGYRLLVVVLFVRCCCFRSAG